MLKTLRHFQLQILNGLGLSKLNSTVLTATNTQRKTARRARPFARFCMIWLRCPEVSEKFYSSTDCPDPRLPGTCADKTGCILKLVVHTDVEDVGSCLPVISNPERRVRHAGGGDGGLASEIHVQIFRPDGPVFENGVFQTAAESPAKLCAIGSFSPSRVNSIAHNLGFFPRAIFDSEVDDFASGPIGRT